MKILFLFGGLLLLLLGLLLFPLPIPFGLPLMLVGLALLLQNSMYWQRQFKRLRLKFSGFSQRLNRIKPKLPEFARRLIEKTDPNIP